MALIKLGALVTQISGKIGGQTLGTGPSGHYIKNNGVPRKSITLYQRDKMSLMATTAQRWRSLTPSQRLTFNNASPEYTYLNRVGETKNYSGFAIFTQLANNVSNSLSPVSGPPVPIPLPRVSFTPLTGVAVTGSGPLMEWHGSNSVVGITYRIFVTKVQSRGVSGRYKNFFFIGQVQSSGTSYVDFQFGDDYILKYGAMPASGKLFWRIDAVSNSTGQSLKGLHSGVRYF